jgi:hypothetical protein
MLARIPAHDARARLFGVDDARQPFRLFAKIPAPIKAPVALEPLAVVKLQGT